MIRVRCRVVPDKGMPIVAEQVGSDYAIAEAKALEAIVQFMERNNHSGQYTALLVMGINLPFTSEEVPGGAE